MPQAVFLTLRAHSGIHAGSGQDLGGIDLPIQRERTTDFPVLRGSSLKGALRQAVEDSLRAGGDRKAAGSDFVRSVFGSDTRDAETGEHAGALSVGDARLVLLPVRSLKGLFAWTTCPFALGRLRRDVADLGPAAAQLTESFPEPVAPSGATVAIPDPDLTGLMSSLSSGSGVSQPRVVLEDYAFAVHPSVPLKQIVTALSQFGLDGEELPKRLALLPDDSFQHFARFATEVVTRVHLDDETKTVKRGQLWTEELLPAESVLVALLVCDDVRREEGGSTAETMLKELSDRVGTRLQVGGNETVGYGVCRAYWTGPFPLAGTTH